MLVAEMLLIMILLAVTGEPLRKVLATYIEALKNLDFFQVLAFDVYLGGFVFYAIALIPLGLFTSTITFIVFGVSFVLLLGYYIKKYFSTRKSGEQQNYSKILRAALIPKKQMIMGIILLLMFFIILWIENVATDGVIFGNVHDASLFSMLSTVISNNRMIPATLYPFEHSGIVYPQGFTVFLTFASYVLNVNSVNLILPLTALFQALGIFGAYFFGKILAGRISHGIIFAFVFTFVSRWPKLLVWGSYAFVAAFPFYLIVLGLIIFQLKISISKKPERVLQLLFLGLMIGYLGAIHAVYFEVTIVTLFIISFIKIIRKQEKPLGEMLNSMAIFVFSLIPVSVFLYRFVISASSGFNVGLPNNISDVKLSSFFENLSTQFYNFMVSDWISPYPILRVITLFFLVLSIIIIALSWKKGWLNRLNIAATVTFSSILGGTIIILFASSEFGLFFLAFATNIPEIAIVMFTSLLLLMGLSIIIIQKRIFLLIRNHLSKMVSLAIIISFFILTFSPFIYYTFTADASYNHGIYDIHAVATPEDRELILKMKNNLLDNSIVLINPYDAGGFIPTLSGYKVIYPFTASRNSLSYTKLYDLIVEGILNKTTYDLMIEFNITNIFVGAKAVSVGDTSTRMAPWNPLLFLGNPNFKLVDRVGNSYLFAFTLQNQNIVLFEDFENTDPQHNGWTVDTSKEGNGTLNISVSSDSKYIFSGNSSLKLSTKALPESISVAWFYRMIYLPHKEENVMLRFYLDSPANFNDSDGITFIISDEAWKNKLFISTWNKGDSIRLLPTSVFHEVDLSSLWFNKFNTSLPRSFYLQIEAYDSNGIEEVFFIDSLNISFRTH